jgi:hypothetical protein
MFLPANRVAAIVGVLTGLAAFISGLAGVLPGKGATTALAIAGAITVAAHTLHFMTGSQKADQLAATAEGPGDPDALPHLSATDPAVVPPDQGDAGQADPAVPTV